VQRMMPSLGTAGGLMAMPETELPDMASLAGFLYLPGPVSSPRLFPLSSLSSPLLLPFTLPSLAVPANN
jgi:hypothetical protein